MKGKNILAQLDQLRERNRETFDEVSPLEAVLIPQSRTQVVGENYQMPDSSETTKAKPTFCIKQAASLFDDDEVFSVQSKQTNPKEEPSETVFSLKSYKEEFEKNPQLQRYKITEYGEIAFENDTICNFLPSIEAVYVDEANPNQRLLDVAVIVKGQKTPVIQQVDSNKICEKNWFERSFAEAIIYTEVPNAARHLSIIVRTLIAARTAQHIYIAKTLGWHRWQGKSFYVCGNRAIGDESFKIKVTTTLNAQCLAVDSNLTLQQVGEGMINLCRIAPSISRFLLTYLVLGLTKQVFVEAGANPRFCLFVSGESGSFKTTLAVFLTRIFNHNQPLTPTAQFTATAAHLEKLLNVFKDTVIVIDDLHPSSSAKARNAMAAKLELVLRIVGDDKCKGRNSTAILGGGVSNPNALAILTGEFFSTEFSSAARCFHLAMNRKDVNLKILNYCQKQPLLLSTFAYYFLNWVALHYDYIVNAIHEQREQYRELKGHYAHARFKDMRDTFLIAHALFLDFLSETGLLNQERHNALFDEFAVLLDKQIAIQQEALKSSDPIKLFFSCLSELIASGRVNIVKRTTEHDAKLHGFYDKSRIYLFKELTYGAVERFLSEQKRRFPVPLNTLIDLLRRKNLIECDTDNRLSKVKINAAFRPRMLIFDRRDFEKLCEK